VSHDRPSKPSAPNARDVARPAQEPVAPKLGQRDPLQPLRDPMAYVRAERQAAAERVSLSLKAWRKVSGAPGGSPRIPAPGAPLADGVRKRLEPQLGADLSGVTVNTSGESAQAAKSLGAKAFTVGQDVHFGAGQYAPGSKEGDRLLAHELTHTVQGQRSGVQRKPAEESHAGHDDAGANGGGAAERPQVSDPDEPAEREADAVADRVTDKLHADPKAAASGDKGGPPKAAADRKDGASAAQAGGKAHEPAPPIAAKLDGVGLKLYRSGGNKLNPRRLPKIEPNPTKFSVSAYDPESDGGKSMVGTCTWSKGLVTLAVYPKDAVVGGAKVSEADRMRGGVIFDALIAAVKSILGDTVKEYADLFKSPGDQAQINEKFQLRGVNGVWGGDSDNLVTFNDNYKAGKTLEESAQATFTGREAAKKLGFVNVKIDKLDPDVRTMKPAEVQRIRKTGFKSVHCTFDK
jgi:hypothetical protein